MLGQHSFDVDDGAADAVEADAGQAHLGLGLATWFGDDHDRLAGAGDVAGVLGESAVEGHVDRTAEVAGCEHFWAPARR